MEKNLSLTKRRMEAERDISDKVFTISLTGDEINTLLWAINTATSLWVKNRRHMPGGLDLNVLTSGCDKLIKPVEGDYQKRCSNVG